MRILSRSGAVLYECEAATMRECMEAAVRTGVSLAGANLTRADLTGVDLTRVDLTRVERAGQPVDEGGEA